MLRFSDVCGLRDCWVGSGRFLNCSRLRRRFGGEAVANGRRISVVCEVVVIASELLPGVVVHVDDDVDDVVILVKNNNNKHRGR